MRNLTRILAPSALLSFALTAQAQTRLDNKLSDIAVTINQVIALLFVIATVVFLWGVVKYITSADSPDARKKAQGIMFWGIIGLAVMVAAWGVANILINYFVGSTSNTIPSAPGQIF